MGQQRLAQYACHNLPLTLKDIGLQDLQVKPFGLRQLALLVMSGGLIAERL